MNGRFFGAIGLLAAFAFSHGRLAGQVDEPTMDFTLGMQALYTHTFPDEGADVASFAARRFRPGVGGSWGPFDYRVMADLAGGSARLLDAWIGHAFSPYATVTFGQGKVPFTRQFLTSYTRLQFVGLSNAASRFDEGRQPGVWLSGSVADGELQYTGGVFNGEGINTPDQNGDLLQVARVVWAPLGPYALAESSLDRPEDPRVALGGGVLSKREDAGEEAADILRLAAEAAFKLRGFNAVGEIFHEERDTEIEPNTETTGLYGQVAYLLESGYEIAFRYSDLDSDSADDDDGESEVGAVVNRYIEGHSMKVQAEFLHFERDIDDTSTNVLRVHLQVAF